MKLDPIVKIVSLVFSLLVAFVGFVAWLTTIQINGQNNSQKITSIEAKIDSVAQDVNKVQTDVALIKQAVGAGRETASAGSTNP